MKSATITLDKKNNPRKVVRKLISLMRDNNLCNPYIMDYETIELDCSIGGWNDIKHYLKKGEIRGWWRVTF